MIPGTARKEFSIRGKNEAFQTERAYFSKVIKKELTKWSLNLCPPDRLRPCRKTPAGIFFQETAAANSPLMF
jgi:hypothetical protein